MILCLILSILMTDIGVWVFQLYKRDCSRNYSTHGMISLFMVILIEAFINIPIDLTIMNMTIGQINKLAIVVTVITLIVRVCYCVRVGIFKYNKICRDIINLEIAASGIKSELSELSIKNISEQNENQIARRNKLIKSYQDEYDNLINKVEALNLEKETVLIRNIK